MTEPKEITELREALKDKIRVVTADIVSTHGYGYDRAVEDILEVLAAHNVGVIPEHIDENYKGYRGGVLVIPIKERKDCEC